MSKSFASSLSVVWSLALSTLLITPFAGGCATTSALVKSGDGTFSEAQARLVRTIVEVDAVNAAALEHSLFLQAEGFYRYRFEPPERDTASYVAQALAAITDFPAFQSLAGSLDLLDLRLRASDSAVQLWETLLQNYPKTPLRPLTLYRLGWAYRFAGAAGLPRESGDEAFDELINERPQSPLAELAREAKAVTWKSKDTAATRSLLPGLGQIYVGETANGAARIAIGVGAAAAIAIPTYIASHRDRDLDWRKDWRLVATGFLGLVVLSFDFTNSYEDAMRGVVQWNERAESAFNRAHPSAP